MRDSRQLGEWLQQDEAAFAEVPAAVVRTGASWMAESLALPLPDHLTRRCRSGNRPGAEGQGAYGAMVRPSGSLQ